MKVNVIEKECMAIVGLAIEFSNSECSSIERVANTVNDSIIKAVEQSKTIVEHGKEEGVRYANATKVPVLIDLETATRIAWLLGNFVHNTGSALFANADNMAIVTLAEINGDLNELVPGGE